MLEGAEAGRVLGLAATLGPGRGVSLGTPTTGHPPRHWILSMSMSRPGAAFILPAMVRTG